MKEEPKFLNVHVQLVTDKGVTRKPHEGSRDYTGLATASYPNGDIYEGHYEAGVR